jgi:hypothetical protein
VSAASVRTGNWPQTVKEIHQVENDEIGEIAKVDADFIQVADGTAALPKRLRKSPSPSASFLTNSG